MKAEFNGVKLEGTPQEISEVISRLLPKKDHNAPVLFGGTEPLDMSERKNFAYWLHLCDTTSSSASKQNAVAKKDGEA